MTRQARHHAIRVAAACLVVWLASAPTGFAGKQPDEKKPGKRRWSFTKAKVGELPKVWRVAETAGVETPATWKVVADPTAPTPPNALAITENKNPNKTFNLLIARRTEYKDLEISVMVKAIAGKMDQGGGPVWRCKDANNYYVARWNPLEDNIRVYYVKNGKRTQLGTADVKVDVKKWHKVGVKHAGNNIEVYLNDKKMIEVEDSTFADPGMIGLWVKADGRTAFDDLRIAPLP